MERSTPLVWQQHNHANTPTPHCSACAPWAVGPNSTGRTACGPRDTGFEHGDYDHSKSAPPTCRGVCAVDFRPTAWGGARPALAQNTTTPSAHCAARLLNGRSGHTPQGEQRAGRAARGLNVVIILHQSQRRRPVAVLVRSSLARRCRQEYTPRLATTPRAKSALLSVCSVSGRAKFLGANSARAARHGIRT